GGGGAAAGRRGGGGGGGAGARRWGVGGGGPVGSPAARWVWGGVAPACGPTTVPSPKSKRYVAIEPSSVELEPSARTESGTSPDEGVTVSRATGGRLVVVDRNSNAPRSP